MAYVPSGPSLDSTPHDANLKKKLVTKIVYKLEEPENRMKHNCSHQHQSKSSETVLEGDTRGEALELVLEIKFLLRLGRPEQYTKIVTAQKTT
jgi:hypothetical protein